MVQLGFTPDTLENLLQILISTNCPYVIAAREKSYLTIWNVQKKMCLGERFLTCKQGYLELKRSTTERSNFKLHKDSEDLSFSRMNDRRLISRTKVNRSWVFARSLYCMTLQTTRTTDESNLCGQKLNLFCPPTGLKIAAVQEFNVSYIQLPIRYDQKNCRAEFSEPWRSAEDPGIQQRTRHSD